MFIIKRQLQLIPTIFNRKDIDAGLPAVVISLKMIIIEKKYFSFLTGKQNELDITNNIMNF